MRSLLNFLARYNHLIIFLILEGISFYYLATRNSYHNTRVMFAFRGLVQGFEVRINDARTYFSLKEINRNLAAENVALKNEMQKLVQADSARFMSVTDTIYTQQYIHTSAEVIENSTNRQKNFFTLNRGRRHGIVPDMSVVSVDGVAGVIVGVSENYSIAMSVLNLDFKLSARLKHSDYFGSLNWDGRNYRHAMLNEIPQHVPLSVGDTIETTGYSAIFPEGVMIGTISEFEKKGGDFYTIRVQLSADLRKLRYVDIVGNIKKKEQMELQNRFQ
ncbi:MAG TPA: rod shape-determining protein MreC [Bacteroidales bacterium]|nr:rod shape-determining protein MreC [Bacteroidales bacterium]